MKQFNFKIDDKFLIEIETIAKAQQTSVSALIKKGLVKIRDKYDREQRQNKHYFNANLDKIRPRKGISDKIRQSIRKKYEFICQKCNITEKEWQNKNQNSFPAVNVLQVAHIEAQCNFVNPKDANHEENLTLLCPECHKKSHANQEDYIDYSKRL